MSRFNTLYYIYYIISMSRPLTLRYAHSVTLQAGLLVKKNVEDITKKKTLF